MALERLSREDWRERAEARLEVAQRLLVAEVEKLQSGDDWQRYLDFQARLHCYSPRNVMLLAIQHERAYREGRVLAQELTQVAGFNTWRMLRRSVDRGQKGYAVLAPVRYTQRVAVDDEGNVRPLGRREGPNAGEALARRQSLRGFKVEFVFDVSQTSGQELPLPPRPNLLVGEAPAGLGAAVMKLLEDSGYRVDTVPDAATIGGANGITDFAAGTVLIRSDMDDAAMVKTLLHEAAHRLLHGRPPGQFLPRPLKEVEAESTAFLVAAAHGMSTGDYSFPYVATWAGADGSKAVLATQDRVATVARQIMRASPAPHGIGGRAPGTEAVLKSQLQRRAGLEHRIEVRGAGDVVKETQRPAVTGERCTCGRLAVIVFVTEVWGEVGWCGWSDGDRRRPCVFCGMAWGHPERRCPEYRLRPDNEKTQQLDRHIDAAEKAGRR